MAADVRVNIEIDPKQIDHVNKLLYTMPDKARTVYRNAINRGLTAAKTQGRKEIKERYYITSGRMKKYEHITMRKAEQTGSDVTGEIQFAGGKIPLYKFRVSPKERRYTSRYANGRYGWRITGKVSAGDIRANGMVRREPAFIAEFKSHHKGIFYRTGEKTNIGKPKKYQKDKLHEYYGPSVSDMLDYEEARDAILERAGEVVEKRIDHELWRVLSGV